MHLAINHLDLNVDIRTLLIFSQLAILEPNIEPPTPTLPAIEAPPLIKTKSTIAIDVKVFTACISDSSKKRLMVVEGNLTTQMLLYAQK